MRYHFLRYQEWAVQQSLVLDLIWLVGCFGFNSPLRQYFSLYWAISQREGEKKRKVLDLNSILYFIVSFSDVFVPLGLDVR